LAEEMDKFWKSAEQHKRKRTPEEEASELLKAEIIDCIRKLDDEISNDKLTKDELKKERAKLKMQLEEMTNERDSLKLANELKDANRNEIEELKAVIEEKDQEIIQVSRDMSKLLFQSIKMQLVLKGENAKLEDNLHLQQKYRGLNAFAIPFKKP